MLKKLSLFLFATLLLNTTTQAVVVTPPVGDRCSEMFNYKGEVYVCADHPRYGKELHRINGGRYSTVIVKDLDPGPGGSNPRAFFESNGWLYFFAETTPTGQALWRTDGTEAGTKLIRSIGAFPDRVVANIGDDFFIINKDSARHASFGNLIRTDGTYEGTKLIEGLVRSRIVGSSFAGVQVGSSFKSLGGNLYFITNNNLYRVNSDGAVSTVYENLPANLPDYYAKITGELFNGKIVIEGVGGSNVAEGDIWLSDGTIAGTVSFITGENEDRVFGPRVINNRLVYGKYNLSNDLENRFKLLSTDSEEEIELYSDRYALGYESSTGSRLVYYQTAVFRRSGFFFTGGTVHSTRFIGLFEPFGSLSYAGFTYVIQGESIYKIDPITGVVQTFANLEGISRLRDVDSPGVLYTASFALSSDIFLWLLKANGTSVELGLVPGFHDIHKEGGRVYFVDPFSEVYGFQRSGIGIWHTNATAASTYQLNYRFENGEPERMPLDNVVLAPIMDLLMDEEKRVDP